VRFAISAVAAASGLLLLGLSFYGQPAVYLRQAGEQWDALMDRPAADQPAVSEADQPPPPDAQQSAARDDAAADRAAQLQQEVARLQQELAARQQTPAPALAPQVSAPQAPAPQAPAPQAPASPPLTATAPSGVVASASPPPAASPPPTVVVTAPLPGAAAAPAMVAPATSVSAPQAARPTAPAPFVAAEPMPVPPVVPVPERHEASVATAPSRTERQPESAVAEPAKAAPVRTETAKVDAARPAQARTESPKVEPPRSPPSKVVVVQKSIPTPPALPQPTQLTPPTPGQEADDAQSVLARLRQVTPAAAPVQQADASAVPERPRPAPSPSLPRLSAARNALANGQIEDARRLLQQAQLQLVFGPADARGDDPPLAGKGAADVAHALDALSANDISLSRRYVDVALGDLSGTPMNPPIQESTRRASGYAPAYPPR
jgi:hypothetical protein